MKLALSICLFTALPAMHVWGQSAQSARLPLFADVALQSEREKLKRHLQERTIGETSRLILNSDNEYRYQSAFWAITQFMPSNPEVITILQRTLAAYPKLEVETRRSFLEALYTLNPPGFEEGLWKLLPAEGHPKLFSMMAVFLYRNNPGKAEQLLFMTTRRSSGQDVNPILKALQIYLELESSGRKPASPDLKDLFRHQRSMGIKTVYSFQRWDRDQPGLTAVQGADGRFARDSTGRYILIPQLARSASSLPYFITNGNTPQGIFSIQGTGQSYNRYIGPTPYLNLLLPFEGYWNRYFLMPADSTDPRWSYDHLLPDSWKSYAPAWEAFTAGNIGRNDIIAHGTTIDPVYFTGKSYYPISPTLGCLCAPEEWDPLTGTLKNSEQLRLVNTFLQAPGGGRGYFMVINVDDAHRPVLREEIEPILEAFEREGF